MKFDIKKIDKFTWIGFAGIAIGAIGSTMKNIAQNKDQKKAIEEAVEKKIQEVMKNK